MTSPDQNTPSAESTQFDPYHKWLGIPPDEQPAHYYQLLGIALYEADADVIDSAAARQMTHVRQCATGPHAEASQKVLNDLSEAQICLLDPQKKADYDARLKVELRAKTSNAAASDGAADNDAKLQQRLRTLDKQKKQAESLLEKGEYAAAIDLLEKMAAVKSPKLARYAKWARQQLPRARRGPKEMQESSAAMYRTAQGLYDRNDYEEAAGILQQIPRKFRGREIQQLLQSCLDVQEEIVALQEDIEHAESLKKYDELLPTVERLLELKPNDRRAKLLRKELKTYGKGGGMRLGSRGDSRFDAAWNASNPLKTALLVLIPLAVFGSVSWLVYDYVGSLQKTIQIEIDDPTATVLIDDKTIEVTGEGDTAKLNVGAHQLKVERDGEVLLTRDFEVVKGKNPVLQISVANAALASSTPDTTVVEDDGQPRVISGHTGAVYGIDMSSDGRRLVTSAGDGTARLWNVKTGEEIRQFKVSDSGIIFSVGLSRDGTRLVTSGHPNQKNTVVLWDTESGEELQRFEGHTKVLQAVAITPDGKTIASGGSGTALKLWNGDQGEQIGEDIQTGFSIVSLLFSHDGKKIFVGQPGQVVAYDVPTGKKGITFGGFLGSALSSDVSRDGTRLLTVGVDKIMLWNAETGEEIRQFSGHSTTIGGVAFLPDGKHLVSGSFDGTVRVWETATGNEIAKFTSDNAEHKVRGMTVSPDGRFAATAGLDEKIVLWPLPDSVSGAGVASTSKTPIVYSKTVREAAEWVISVGGKVTIQGQPVADAGQLPINSFEVERIDLMGCKVTDRDSRHLTPLSSSTVLLLNNTSVGDESMKMFSQFKGLQQLHIDATKVTRRGLAELSDLSDLHLLKTYGLGLVDSDLQHFVAHPQLVDINLASNPISDRGLAELRKLSKLRSLQLQRTDVTDDGLNELKQIPSLRSLYLGSPKITNAGAKNLAGLTELRSLRFYGATNISDDSIDDLVKLQKLTDLWLVGTGVTEQGVARLKAALPNADVVRQ